MSEWWTYGLSDLLLFSPSTYYRLLERYNLAVWPAQPIFLALGLALPFLLRRGRMAAAILAAAWLWVAWKFHLRHYAGINWAADYFAAAFFVEAALLVWVGVIRKELRPRLPGHGIELAAIGIYLLALLAWPAIAPVEGRPWPQAEVFGAAPDPTAVATLAIALLGSPPARWLLLPIPLLWCAVGGATLWAMQAPHAFALPLAAALTLVLAFVPGRRQS